MKLVRIPAGHFLYGEDKESIYLPEYHIGQHPVTNKQYRKFVKATGRAWESLVGMKKKYKNHPAIHISWYDAVAYCEWLADVEGRPYRLPTEAEWEKAARGVDGWEYPWGDEWKDGMCNTREMGIGDTTPVGQFSPRVNSQFGVVDAAGNVWEWTNSWYDDEKVERVLRGGAWLSNRNNARCAYRNGGVPDFFYDDVGFRVVSPPSQQYNILVTIQISKEHNA